MNCTICGAMTRALIQPATGHCYYRCDHCDFIFKAEEHVVSAEEERREYDLHVNSIDDPRYVAYFKRFVEAAVVGHVTIGKNGLDFGSGPEPVLAEILERDYGYRMDIYDLFYAPEKVFAGRRYDLITCTEVAEHLRDPLAFFRLARELLQEDGLLAVMTQFHPEGDEAALKAHYLRDQTHISFFSFKTMETVAALTGLEVVYTDHKRYTAFRRRG
ncbi:class I SAM-dependent methyltransferase [Acidaminobacter hydrogenoformans]|uniref:Methyltransferase domain-containing protein n=1 Tax=Acidaminobacter hydrogenoformans DSM 2784 TaxID=1120920 RepID=A0A1G5RQU7_9FIRM|nr:class I SAM-dependent methyltransferase [Acidaminobacter hydrogenoformans]SCZ76443.1 Methyltransferase domain-containing protein [Acidaminobacter hydrogenoformans DSM 2784]